MARTPRPAAVIVRIIKPLAINDVRNLVYLEGGGGEVGGRKKIIAKDDIPIPKPGVLTGITKRLNGWYYA